MYSQPWGPVLLLKTQFFRVHCTGFVHLFIFLRMSCCSSLQWNFTSQGRPQTFFFFCLRCFECSVQSIPPQLHEACHSIAKQDSRTKFIVIQVWESCVCSKDDSSMRQSAQESKNWNLTWLSKVLLSILYPILKRNVLSWTKVSVLSNSTATHMIMLLLSYGWCLKWNSKQEEECRFISTFKPLGMGHPLS